MFRDLFPTQTTNPNPKHHDGRRKHRLLKQSNDSVCPKNDNGDQK